MPDILTGMRVVELASFVAGPSCGLNLLQNGAEVIRIDPIGGAADYGRLPLAPTGDSLYWQGLNKGKKSVELDLSRPEGRELAFQLLSADDDKGGLFVTNQPANRGPFSSDKLQACRPDLVTVRIMGWADGRAAVDYTINCEAGIPLMTGPEGGGPVNHVLPAWDLLAGAQAAFGLVAAERCRRETGVGCELRIPLGELALSTLGNLGLVGSAVINGEDRASVGNYLYGSFGRDFVCADGKRLMIVALTDRQWTGLVRGLSIATEIESLEDRFGISLADSDGARYQAREEISAIVAARLARLCFAEVTGILTREGVLWGAYNSIGGVVSNGLPEAVFCDVTHPGDLTYPTSKPAIEIWDAEPVAPHRAPRLGEHTSEVLRSVLSLSDAEIHRLQAHGIVRCSDQSNNGARDLETT